MAQVSFSTDVLNGSVEVKASSGGLRLLTSGSIFSFVGQDILLEISNLKFNLKFVSRPENSTSRVEFALSGDDPLALDVLLINITGVGMGQGTLAPYEVGNLGGYKLHLGFFVQGISNESIRDTRCVQYSFYLGEAIDE